VSEIYFTLPNTAIGKTALKSILNQMMMKPIFSTALFLVLVASANAQTGTTPSKLGYADVEYIFAQLPEAKQIQAELNTLQGQLSKQIELKDQELKKKYGELVAGEKDMLPAMRDNILREIEDSQNNLDRFKQEAQENVQRKQSQLIQPVYKKMSEAIAAVARANGFTMILSPRVSGMDMILYAAENTDVSDLVLKQLGVTPKPAPAK
jgi:outer membrane protein